MCFFQADQAVLELRAPEEVRGFLALLATWVVPVSRDARGIREREDKMALMGRFVCCSLF